MVHYPILLGLADFTCLDATTRQAAQTPHSTRFPKYLWWNYGIKKTNAHASIKLRRPLVGTKAFYICCSNYTVQTFNRATVGTSKRLAPMLHPTRSVSVVLRLYNLFVRFKLSFFASSLLVFKLLSLQESTFFIRLRSSGTPTRHPVKKQPLPLLCALL